MVKNSIAGLGSPDNSKNQLPSGDAQKLGRKPKPVADKARHPITLKFTDEELEAIGQKAGLTAKATFLKHLLKTKTDIFK